VAFLFLLLFRPMKKIVGLQRNSIIGLCWLSFLMIDFLLLRHSIDIKIATCSHALNCCDIAVTTSVRND